MQVQPKSPQMSTPRRRVLAMLLAVALTAGAPLALPTATPTRGDATVTRRDRRSDRERPVARRTPTTATREPHQSVPRPSR